MKIPFSAAVDSQVAESVRAIAKAQDRSVSWVVDRALRQWLGTGRQVGADGWSQPHDGGFEELYTNHMARLLGTSAKRLAWAQATALRAAEVHYFGASGSPEMPPPPDEADDPEAGAETTKTRGRRAATQEVA